MWTTKVQTSLRIRPVWMRAFVICSLEKVNSSAAKLGPLKALSFYLVSVNNKVDFSKIWLHILKKWDTAHIESAHYPYQTVTIQADRRHFRSTCT